IVHCPRSHTFFQHAPFALEKLTVLGFNICLGTDSLASNSSLSLLAEVRELLRNEPWMSPRDALEMVTINPAAALRESGSLGKISAGFCADLIAVPSIASETEVFEKIASFEGVVPWMMVNGCALISS
ncbi:MAG: amidohydrolase family protein, partial [Chthoniobacterales bacterium]